MDDYDYLQSQTSVAMPTWEPENNCDTNGILVIFMYLIIYHRAWVRWQILSWKRHNMAIRRNLNTSEVLYSDMDFNRKESLVTPSWRTLEPRSSDTAVWRVTRLYVKDKFIEVFVKLSYQKQFPIRVVIINWNLF